MKTITALDLINLSLKQAGVLGVGQTALAEDINDAFLLLNMLLAQWQRKRWLVYTLADVTCQATGQVSYTVGPGEQFDCPRPDRIEYSFFRNNVSSPGYPVDYPLSILQSREDYNSIAVKQLGTWPAYAYYDPKFPIGVFYPWPVPQSIYQLFITIKTQLQSFTNLTDIVQLPPEYYMAILYNLSARLRPAYQLPPDPTVVALAAESLNVIRGANTQIPILRMPSQLRRGAGYNPFSDQGS